MSSLLCVSLGHQSILHVYGDQRIVLCHHIHVHSMFCGESGVCGNEVTDESH